MNSKKNVRALLATAFAFAFLWSGQAFATSAQEKIDAYKAKSVKVADASHGHDAPEHAVSPASHAEPAPPKEVAPPPAPKPVKAAKVVEKKSEPAAKADSHGHAEPVPTITPEEALKKLLDGNERVSTGKSMVPNRSAARRAEVAAGQRPFVVVVTCSDSRVPPEILFDQGYGDIFVVRTAGNVVDDIALGSIEYAVAHLGVRLVLVLGHSKCGAVKATVDGGEVPGHLPAIVTAIQPAVESVRGKPGDLMTNSVKANVKFVTQKIIQSAPGFTEMLENCELRIAGAVYDLDTGKVALTYQPVL